MRGECVCLHVSVCVRADSAAFTCSLSPALSLSLPSPPLRLSPFPSLPLSLTHTQFSISPPFSSFPPSSPRSSLPASLSVPPPPLQPCLCLFGLAGGYLCLSEGARENIPAFRFPSTIPFPPGRSSPGLADSSVPPPPWKRGVGKGGPQPCAHDAICSERLGPVTFMPPAFSCPSSQLRLPTGCWGGGGRESVLSLGVLLTLPSWLFGSPSPFLVGSGG